jgi:hypothetical protein
VLFQFRFRYNDPSDFSAKLFRRKSALHIDHSHLFLFQTENSRICVGQQHIFFSCKKQGRLTMCGYSSGYAARILPILVPNCSEQKTALRFRSLSLSFLSDRKFSNMWSTTHDFNILKTGLLDFVRFQLRFLWTDPSKFAATLFGKKSAFYFLFLPPF